VCRAAFDAGKILVNPNGADLDSYRPASAETSVSFEAPRFRDDDCVIGFTRPRFGWWTASTCWRAALPSDLREAPAAKSC